MAKNQNTKEITATVLMAAGVLAIISAIIINAVLIIGQVGWFGAAQLSNIGSAVTIFKANPVMMVVALALFFIGGGMTKVGSQLSK